MTTKTIDLILNLKAQSANAGAKQIAQGLKSIEEQANRTREKMEKLAQVGSKLALVGAAITAPFALAMKKYVDSAKETEPVSRRIVELSKKWEDSQVRLGRVTATIVLPALEKGVAILDKIITFAEKNPGVVQAALTIGSTLVILGGIITTTAQLVSTVATLQGLAASAGMGGAAAGAAGGAGLSAAVAAGITTASAYVIPALVAALSVAIGAQIGLGLGNALAGTNYTLADIGENARMLLTIVKVAWLDRLPKLISAGLQALGGFIGNAIKAIATYIGNAIKAMIDGIKGLFAGGRAAGGYVGSGIYRMGEKGREFVLSNDTTRNAERAIGGPLTQGGVTSMITNNLQIGPRDTIGRNRRVLRDMRNDIINSLVGA